MPQGSSAVRPTNGLLVNVDHNSMAVHLTRRECKGFPKCCISSTVDKTDDDLMWNSSDDDGTVRIECEEDEGTNCEDGDSDTDC